MLAIRNIVLLRSTIAKLVSQHETELERETKYIYNIKYTRADRIQRSEDVVFGAYSAVVVTAVAAQEAAKAKFVLTQ